MEIPTLINAGSKINGELMFNSDVRIDGEVLGKLESDKSAFIGQEGYVKGFLRARDLVVFGRIEGNIVVTGGTVLHPGSSIFGNLYTRMIEVKEGAIVTARVITYDKLESFDEAQIHMAEEMIKIQPGRRKVPAHTTVKISFDDNPDISGIEDVQGDLPKELVINEQMTFEQGDILSGISAISEMQEFSIAPPLKAETLLVVENEVDSVTSEIEMADPAESAESKVENPIDSTLNETADLSPVNSVSIASSLGEPVKIDPFLIRVGRKKSYRPDANMTIPIARKGKERTLPGFDDLKTLLTKAKYSEIIQFEKKETLDFETKNSPEKSNPHKPADDEMSNAQSGNANKGFTINDAISQLPIDDYSSLFK